MERLGISESTRLLVLTGAGMSAESGISTFRDAGGLWENHRVEEVASPQGFVQDPKLVWRFYSLRRQNCAKAQPNPGHRALARLEEKMGDRFLLVTQNVDGLHLRAGNKRVLEIHGNLQTSRCSVCDREPVHDEDIYIDSLPYCGRCEEAGRSALLRPHIVWFGEALDGRHLAQIEDFVSEAGSNLQFLAVGTSGAVYPAAALVEVATACGGSTTLLNLESADNSSRFDRVILGKAGEVLPELLGTESAG